MSRHENLGHKLKVLDGRSSPTAAPLPCLPPYLVLQRAKPTTICDGLEARLGSLTWPIVRDLVDDVITVSEEEVVAAMQLVMERMKVGAGRGTAGGQARQAGRQGRQADRAPTPGCLGDACRRHAPCLCCLSHQYSPASSCKYCVLCCAVLRHAVLRCAVLCFLRCRWWWSHRERRGWQRH